jgi:hypothetical protein
VSIALPNVASILDDVKVAEPLPPSLRQIATLDSNRAKARFGVAYFKAVCSQAGIGFSETPIDEDVLAVDGTVNFAEAPVMVQIKCTGRFRVTGGATASWPAEATWREKWKKSRLPVYFVLVIVDPDEQTAWLDHRQDDTVLKSAAFWVRVDQESEGVSITVPKNQRLTSATFKLWYNEMEASFTPVSGGDGVGR